MGHAEEKIEEMGESKMKSRTTKTQETIENSVWPRSRFEFDLSESECDVILREGERKRRRKRIRQKSLCLLFNFVLKSRVKRGIKIRRRNGSKIRTEIIKNCPGLRLEWSRSRRLEIADLEGLRRGTKKMPLDFCSRFHFRALLRPGSFLKRGNSLRELLGDSVKPRLR